MQVRSVTAHVETPAIWVRTGPDSAIPATFTGEIRLEEPLCTVRLRVVVRNAGGQAVGPGVSPVVESLTVERLPGPAGPGVTSRLVRGLAVDELVQHLIAEVSEKAVDWAAAGVPGAFQLVRDVAAGRTDLGYAGAELAPRKGRGRDTSDDRLRRVAQLYREAGTADRPPTRFVADQLPCAYSTAGRLVSQARKHGYLRPTIPGRRGEQ